MSISSGKMTRSFSSRKTFQSSSPIDGLLFATDQVKYYSDKYPSCDRIITTNGFRYCIYKKIKKDFKYYSYINLLDLKWLIDRIVKKITYGR